MAAGEEALAVLRSIDASLKTLVSFAQRREAKQQAAAPKALASDRELDGKYGDPVVKFDPRDWTGPLCKGRRLSECPADFLELLAETFDYFAIKAASTNEITDKGK